MRIGTAAKKQAERIFQAEHNMKNDKHKEEQHTMQEKALTAQNKALKRQHQQQH